MCQAVHGVLLQIECQVSRGYSGLQLIGHTTEVCRQGLDRAKTALESAGRLIPNKKIVINIAPAELKKDGSQLDLAMAIAVAIQINNQEPKINLKKWLFTAELGLGGELKPVSSLVPYLSLLLANQFEGIVIASEGIKEMAWLWGNLPKPCDKIKIVALPHLSSVLQFVYSGRIMEDGLDLSAKSSHFQGMTHAVDEINFDDMILTPDMKNLAMTVAAGRHSLFLTGSPGAGKSMFASRLMSILPDMSPGEHWEALAIHSRRDFSADKRVVSGRPPFRCPHHQASAAAIIGGAKFPGEISLAHGGILFLDEFPEFRRDIVEGLREPLETKEVRVARADARVGWHANMILVAAANNCPCGWLGSTKNTCRCPMTKIQAYKRKISGPILDRIDLHFNMPETQNSGQSMFASLSSLPGQTKTLSRIVEKARAFAMSRNRQFGRQLNDELSADELIPASKLGEAEFLKLIEPYAERSLTRRSLIRALRVARTLADLRSDDQLQPRDLAQAWSWQKEAVSQGRGDEAYGFG
jgi:magnesium chelatase family protein